MTTKNRTQVGIIGSGPAGLLLARLLHVQGVESVILEQKDRAYVEGRIRAGVLEQGTVDLLRQAGVDARLIREGLVHTGAGFAFGERHFRIDFEELTGKTVVVYGQTEITRDLITARLAGDGPIFWNVADVAFHDLETTRPRLTFTHQGQPQALHCDFVIGCDGFHGASRKAMPANVLKIYERVYAFGWLGILADVPPCAHELIYARHDNGFALASMRSPTRSRYYIQCELTEKLEDWPDARIWDELALRLGPEAAAHMTRGPAIEKSIAPLRSFVAAPMRHGRLFLAGDAAHIVPPTGAKGLNLAASDVHYLSNALVRYYKTGDHGPIDGYSDTALARVWKAERFSWWMTNMFHKLHDAESFEAKMQLAELDYLSTSRAAQTALAENYVGLPF